MITDVRPTTGSEARPGTRLVGEHPARDPDAPLRVLVLVSATGANLGTLLRLQAAEPELLDVALVASHGRTAPALDVARTAGVPTWDGDFDDRCGRWSDAVDDADRETYARRSREWHDDLDERLRCWEAVHGALDLVVLAYHRWIDGALLDRFDGRMLNMHPGDLADVDGTGRRLLVGRDPVLAAMEAGRPWTRSCCFLVDGTRDGGAVLCSGPPVPVEGGPVTRAAATEQELRMKRASDPAALEWTVRAVRARRLAVAPDQHADGSRVVLVDGLPTPLGGRRLGPGEPVEDGRRLTAEGRS